MKPIKLLTLFFTFFMLTVKGFTQTPDRVLSAEEFRQQKIEEKRQQLKWEIMVRENDRMTTVYDYSMLLTKPCVKALRFLDKKYTTTGDIRDILKSGQNSILKNIFASTNDELNQMFLVEGRKMIDFLYNFSSSLSSTERGKIFSNYYDKLVNTFNAFLAASSENREKVAQAIRDYRLAEYIKNELPDIEAEREGDYVYNRLSDSNYRFIGFTLSVGLAYPYSDDNNHYDLGQDGPDKYNFPPFFGDFNISFAYLFRAAKKINIGFIIETGIAYFNNPSMLSFGGKLMLGLKLDRVLFTFGSYIYFKVYEIEQLFYSTSTFKSVDIGLVGTMGYLFGSRMNYLLALELRINLNKNLKTMKLAGYPGTLINPDDVGFAAILIKFGYGF